MKDTIITEVAETEKVEIVAPKQQEYKFVGFIHLKKGMKLWQYDKATDIMIETPTKFTAIADMNGEAVKNKTAQHNPELRYFQACNKCNTVRKLFKDMLQFLPAGTLPPTSLGDGKNPNWYLNLR